MIRFDNFNRGCNCMDIGSVLNHIVQEVQRFFQSPNGQKIIRKTLDAWGPGIIIDATKKIKEFFRK